MKRIKLRSKDIRQLGFEHDAHISMAMHLMGKYYKYDSIDEQLNILTALLKNPEEYQQHQHLNILALQLLDIIEDETEYIELNKHAIPFAVYGKENIDEQAIHQMYQAARLPISVAAAIMPDAHSGYGLPIGGVLATKNAIIPYGVGVDIGCRMCLSIFDLPIQDIKSKEKYFAQIINDNTKFGSGGQLEKVANHKIMDHQLFSEITLLKHLHGKAWKQLGTSGSGNHFVEFGIVAIEEKDEILNVAPGNYIGLLSHSGSRALGASIANHYTTIAIEKRKLPHEAKNLAWLSLQEEAGIEYWMAMNLAGDYAKACHDVIHEKVAKQLGRKPIAKVENHHNFAWKELLDQQEVIVHRKGATPAEKNVLGIIPGSMTASGYIVKGKGEPNALNSASHGAGRKMSRSKASNSITQKQMNDELAKHSVRLLGAGLDEAPFAYKDIDQVMSYQKSLVEIIGKFSPKIVKMDGTPARGWKQKRDDKVLE